MSTATNATLAAIRRLRAAALEVEVAIRHDTDLPTIERDVDGGIRWRLRPHLAEVKVAGERLEREVTEALAEWQRVQEEAGEVEPTHPPYSHRQRASHDAALHGLPGEATP